MTSKDIFFSLECFINLFISLIITSLPLSALGYVNQFGICVCLKRDEHWFYVFFCTSLTSIVIEWLEKHWFLYLNLIQFYFELPFQMDIFLFFLSIAALAPPIFFTLQFSSPS